MGAKLASLSGVLGATQDRGLSFITSSTFSAAASVSVNSCFTSTYENYRVLVNISSTSTHQGVSFRFRAGGSDDTSSVYDYGIARIPSTGSIATPFQSQNLDYATLLEMTDSGVMEYSLVMDFLRPQTANKKNVIVSGVGGPYALADVGLNIGAVSFTNTTAFDGFTLSVPGTFGGSVAVYGYRKAL